MINIKFFQSGSKFCQNKKSSSNILRRSQNIKPKFRVSNSIYSPDGLDDTYYSLIIINLERQTFEFTNSNLFFYFLIGNIASKNS